MFTLESEIKIAMHLEGKMPRSYSRQIMTEVGGYSEQKKTNRGTLVKQSKTEGKELNTFDCWKKKIKVICRIMELMKKRLKNTHTRILSLKVIQN